MESTSASSADLALSATANPEPSKRDEEQPTPIPIYRTGTTYYLFDADAITYLRANHNIPGVLSGSLPQSPQQNVFLGLPLQLMPEEARLLVEKKVCIIVDNALAHREGLRATGQEGRRAWKATLAERGRGEGQRKAMEAKKRAVEAVGSLKGEKAEKARRALGLDPETDISNPKTEPVDDTQTEEQDEPSLFTSSEPTSTSSTLTKIPSKTPEKSQIHHITPTRSTFLPKQPSPSTILPNLPPVPSSYPIYAHLHSKGYFLSPGLRFGCQYLAYPGDPLRFHSHFLVVGCEWDEEIDLQMLVAGGRLGTGVKKGFLIGGATQADTDDANEEDGEGEVDDEERDGGFGLHSRRSLKRMKRGEKKEVRTFCIEWSGM